MFNAAPYFSGDRYARQATSPDDPCLMFSNPVNNKFYSPGYPNNYTSNTDCILVLTGKHFSFIEQEN